MIQTSDSYEELSATATRMLDAIAQNPGIQSPDVDLRLNKPELRITGNRERAAGSYAKALVIDQNYKPAVEGFKRVGGQSGKSYQAF